MTPWIRRADAVALGGGGGLLEVTLPACRALGLKTVLVETIYGTGGSSRRIADWLRPIFGETPAPGNLAAAFQRTLQSRLLDPVLEYRVPFDDDRPLTDIIHERLSSHLASFSLWDSIGRVRDRLCDFARDWDARVGGIDRRRPLPSAGNSIRNLLVLWYWLYRHRIYCGQNRVAEDRMVASLNALHRCFEIEDTLVLPVSIQPGVLFARYGSPITDAALRRSGLDPSYRASDPHVIVGQHAINLLGYSKIVDFDLLGVATEDGFGLRPKAFAPVLAALQSARLIVVGAGSFFTSQLACLAVAGVLETIASRPEVPRVMFINPYHLDQTRGLTVLDFVGAVERLAQRVFAEAPEYGQRRRVRFEDIFSDVIVGAPSDDRRILALLSQRATVGEARGAIHLAAEHAKLLEARGLRVHCGDYMRPQPKLLKRPGNPQIEIAGYDPLRIATVFSDL